MISASGFIVDESLAGVAKWLRLLGFDTVVHQGEAGRIMMRRATQEQRILLTRRRDMIERQFSGRICLVPAIGIGPQLQYLVEKLSLEISMSQLLRICLICNRQLHLVGREEIRDIVSPHVLENGEEFNRCGACGRIYWKGTHVRNALAFLEENNVRIMPERG